MSNEEIRELARTLDTVIYNLALAQRNGYCEPDNINAYIELDEAIIDNLRVIRRVRDELILGSEEFNF